MPLDWASSATGVCAGSPACNAASVGGEPYAPTVSVLGSDPPNPVTRERRVSIDDRLRKSVRSRGQGGRGAHAGTAKTKREEKT
ncbi:hypothetical protein F8M49_11610 [Rhodococcus zopfii]|uniref:Uncharacterized protein n=1 Tax=Rhodococcus zopfii TaxID=43772 RepID=A0ABU3WPD4_9NOCA|nr:hypothetical protein [Rhodococcus zopfii]